MLVGRTALLRQVAWNGNEGSIPSPSARSRRLAVGHLLDVEKTGGSNPPGIIGKGEEGDVMGHGLRVAPAKRKQRLSSHRQ